MITRVLFPTAVEVRAAKPRCEWLTKVFGVESIEWTAHGHLSFVIEGGYRTTVVPALGTIVCETEEPTVGRPVSAPAEVKREPAASPPPSGPAKAIERKARR